MKILGEVEEASRLLGTKDGNCGGYGTYENFSGLKFNNDFSSRERRLTEESGEKISKIPVRKLFRYATANDKWILAIGTVCAVIHGAGFPFLAMTFGRMTNIFIEQTLYGFSNDTVMSDNLNYSTSTISLLGVNASSNLEQGISRERFAYVVNQCSLYYLIIGIVVYISSFIQAVCWECASERQAYRLRQEFFFEVLRKEISWYDNHQTGDLTVKLSDDLERVREGIGHKFSMTVQHISGFIVGIIIGFFTSWKLTLTILSVSPILAAASAFSGKMINTQSVREQLKYGKAGGVAEEVLSSIKTVASFGGEKREIERYSLALSEGLRAAIRKYHVFAVAIGLVFFVMYSSHSLAIWYACRLLEENEITPGDVFTIFFSVLLGTFGLGNAIPFLTVISHAKASGAIVFSIIDTKPSIDAYSNDGIIPDKLTGHIEFRDVTFRYPSRKALSILKNFNLDIPAGKKVAIVGCSGSGKSTILNLLLRFYDPDIGAVLIDGNDLKALNLAWIRHHIGYVSQEPVLFEMTIYDNIRYGREGITMDQVIQAAKWSYAHDFIVALPQGYNTLVGERGSQISVGQKQRIAIARALVRDPKVLLLDEATSALDSKSEAVVQVALDQAAKGRTTIIVAHRLSTVKDADIIYAIKDGEIVESGTHQELMSLEGFYHDLVSLQLTATALGDDSSQSADESGEGEESGKEFSMLLKYNQAGGSKPLRKKQRKHFKKTRAVIPDPHRDRLLEETDDLDVKLPSFLKIIKFDSSHYCALFIGGIGCIITGLGMPVFAFFYSEMYTVFSKRGEDLREYAVVYSLLYLGLAAVSFIGYWIRTDFVAIAGEHLTTKLRLESFSTVIRQPINWFDNEKNSPSRIATRLARDAPIVKAAAGHRLAIVMNCVITGVVAEVIAFYFGWQLALVLLVCFPLLAFAGYVEFQVQKGGQKKDAKLMQEAGHCANEAIANIRTVQSLGQERTFCERYFDLLYPTYIEAHRQGLFYGIAYAFAEGIVFLVYAGAFRFGAYLVETGHMDGASVYRAFFAVAFCAVSVGHATNYVPDYNKARMAAGLMFHLIEQKSTIDPFCEAGLRPALKGRIEYKDVYFRYPTRPDVAVLRGLSIQIEPGQTIALIGPSGVGKSTVLSLLERFYDVVSGHVMIDGYDVRSLNIHHLRAHIGVVTQEPVVFDCTIRENIAYGYADGSIHVPEELIIEAARAANIHKFIIGLPNGYNTIVGERGVLLSGGEKQRIAIARALIRDPKILILDEATSALDTENEKLVQDALEKARIGRTCIIIAHRLSTVQNADCIAVMNRGRIVEMGSHDQLKSAKGMYYQLTRNQHISH